MSDGPTAATWASLREQRSGAEDQLATMPVAHHGVDTPLMYGIDEPGHLCLLIPVAEVPTVPIHPDLRGLRVRIKRLPDGAFIAVMADATCERAFCGVCTEIVIAIVEHGRRPINVVASVLKAWAALWKPAKSLMADITQIGLMGELIALEKIIMPAVGPAAIGHWTGPDKELNDFVGDFIHVEVKTTTKSWHEHVIATHDQLSVPAGRDLFVISILLESSAAGTMSLATQIDRVTDLLRGEPEHLDDFLVKVGKYEWTEEMRYAPELIRFNLHGSGIFPVDDFFPRLPDGFVLPPGVKSLKYVSDLANIPSAGAQDLQDRLREGF